MKSSLSLLLTVILIFSLTACGSTKNNTSELEVSGITTNASADKTFSDYVGVWSEENISWEMGGLILKISIEEKEMEIYCSLTQSAPDSRVAEFTQKIKLSEIKDNVATIDYDDDCWGNSGTAEITFSNGYLVVDFKNIVTDEMAMWGFYENTYKLEKNDKAIDMLIAGSDEYYENLPETPVYDTSKASGILASIGMTEEEFKNSCTPMLGGIWVFNINNERYRYYYVPYGKQYYQENPNDEKLQRKINYWNGPNASYYKDKYSSLEEYLSAELYSRKGQDILFDNTSKLLDKMREYPNDYIGQHFVILSPIGYVYDFIYSSKNYSSSYVSIEDRRDDIHNPNILDDKEYLCYVIFTGSNGTVVNFDLISIEEVSE